MRTEIAQKRTTCPAGFLAATDLQDLESAEELLVERIGEHLVRLRMGGRFLQVAGMIGPRQVYLDDSHLRSWVSEAVVEGCWDCS
jgi:hypothetical protein